MFEQSLSANDSKHDCESDGKKKDQAQGKIVRGQNNEVVAYTTGDGTSYKVLGKISNQLFWFLDQLRFNPFMSAISLTS